MRMNEGRIRPHFLCKRNQTQKGKAMHISEIKTKTRLVTEISEILMLTKSFMRSIRLAKKPGHSITSILVYGPEVQEYNNRVLEVFCVRLKEGDVWVSNDLENGDSNFYMPLSYQAN